LWIQKTKRNSHFYSKRQAVKELDRSMRDIMNRPDLPFGGKTVVFGGDFRQVLPVV
jgi:ATP-dependent DNA helicase PIF1